MKRAFTLIELLIVVAIIAILAAIAVPNFLEAQVRSKVSRVKSDLRTYATAIESYTVDNNRPPREAHFTLYGDTEVNPNPTGDDKLFGNISNILSTPVAYITTARFPDIFQDKNLLTAIDERYYTYWDNRSRAQTTPVLTSGWGTPFFQANQEFYGDWRMLSVGPDRRYLHGPTLPGIGTSGNMSYEATNGTISQGNIHRSQKLNDSRQPDPGKAYPPSNYVLLVVM